MDRETTMAEGTTKAITSAGKETPTSIKAVNPKITSKEMPPLLETLQMHVSNAEKWDISPETAQSVTKAINTTAWPT